MSTYFATLTELGEAKIANATALGTTIQLTHMGVGDAFDQTPIPDRTQEELLNERYRAPLNRLVVDAANPSQIIVEQVLPESVGGWWIREIGVYDEDGYLCAVANCPPSYKPQLSEGSGRTQVVRMVLLVSSTEAVELKIDPAVVLATRAYVEDYVEEYAAPLIHQHDAADIVSGQLSAQRIPSLAIKKTTGLQAALDAKAPLDSPEFINSPTVPTPDDDDDSERAANTEFVQAAIAAAAFPSGTRMPFAQAAAPTGWTQDTSDDADNRMLRVVKTAGGGVAGSHSPILNNVVPAHTHGVTTGNASSDHTHGIGDPGHSHVGGESHNTNLVGGDSGAFVRLTNAAGENTAVAYTGIWAGGISAGHSHSGGTDNGSSQTNWTPRYIDLIICEKN